MIPAMVAALAVGGVLSAISQGRWRVPVAAWLAPVALLIFAAEAHPMVGYVGVLAALSLATWFSWRGLIPLPSVALLGFSIGSGAVGALAFLAFGLVLEHASVWVAVSIFPLMAVILDFVNERASRFGDWGSTVHALYGDLPLLQSASISPRLPIGVINWVAAATAALVTAEVRSDAWRPFVVGICCMVALQVFGGIRLLSSRTPARTVRVAAICEPDPVGEPSFSEIVATHLSAHRLDEPEWAALRQAACRQTDTVIGLTEREAAAGAEIVAWAEGAGLVPAEDERQFSDRIAAVARRYRIYIAASLAVLHRDSTLDNKVLVLGPNGQMGPPYHKRHLVPGPEATHTRRHPSTPLVIDTPFGRIGIAICFDADHHDVWTELARLGADIVLIPSSDWEAIGAHHADIAVVRAIRAGVAVVRPARYGTSIAADRYGRTLATNEYTRGSDHSLVAHVPIAGPNGSSERGDVHGRGMPATA